MKTLSLLLLITLACSVGIGQENTSSSMLNKFVWNELATQNVQGAKDFYGKVFGWEFLDKKTGDMTYTMIKVNGDDVGGIWAIPQDKQQIISPHWLAYILVDDIDAMLAKATKNGATVVKPVMSVGDWGKLVIFKDPTGAEIALWQAMKK